MTLRPFLVQVPCTTANLGAGFDALGLALSGFWLTVRVKPVSAGGLRISDLSGEGAGRLPTDARNRLLVAAKAAAKQAGVPYESLNAELSVHSDIPLSRGLGSSAAAAVAGAQVVDALLDGALGQDGVLDVAATLEGHPDNVAPALRGGMQVAVKLEGGKFLVCPVPMRAPLKAAVFIPDQELSTEKARAVLPQQVSLKAAVYNLGRAALQVAALAEGRLDLLAEAMRDALHQTPRSQLMPWLPSLIEAALAAGAYGASLSGAGTTVFAFVPPDQASAVADAFMRAAQAAGLPGKAHVVDLALQGTRVEAV